MTGTPIVILLSGGQDSTTCAFWARHMWPTRPLLALTIDYDQRHQRELDAAWTIGHKAGVSGQRTLKVGPILEGASPLTDHALELEQYPDGDLPGGLEKTYVPGRNALFLTLAANHAYCNGARDIVIGVSEADYGGYPDCRFSFIDAMQDALNAALPEPHLILHTPLIDRTKGETVELACRLPGCYPAMAFTHTSYDGAWPPTGHDHATVLRAQGFNEAGVPDPLVVRAALEGLMPLPTTDNYSSVYGIVTRLRGTAINTEVVLRESGITFAGSPS